MFVVLEEIQAHYPPKFDMNHDDNPWVEVKEGVLYISMIYLRGRTRIVYNTRLFRDELQQQFGKEAVKYSTAPMHTEIQLTLPEPILGIRSIYYSWDKDNSFTDFYLSFGLINLNPVP